jgi:single-strand DNA-binding protein
MNFNQAVICGNMTREPELRQVPSGQSVCSFTVATNRIYSTADKKRREEAEFHNVVAWGKQAEILAQYGKKGTLIMIAGRLQTRSWEDKTHPQIKHYRTEIIVRDFQFGPKTSKAEEVPPMVEETEEESTPEDMPF